MPARKDLAAAFRRVNPNTGFDIARADKWLHGRARPRDPKVYEDWAKLLDIERPGPWIAESDVEEFLLEVALRHGRDPEELRQRLDVQSRAPVREAPGLSLAGTYAVYTHAWSPYFKGRLIRGGLTIGIASRAEGSTGRYAEVLPTGRLQLEGAVALDKRALRIEVADVTQVSQYLNFSLFPPSPPVSVLGGLMFGTTLIGPDATPSVTRAVLVRLPAPSPRLEQADAYLAEGVSVAADLKALGLPVGDAKAVDRVVLAFMRGAGRDGVDQISAAAYRELLELFDRLWLTRGGTGND